MHAITCAVSTLQNKAAAEGNSSAATEEPATTATATESNSTAVDVSLGTADTADFTNPAPSPGHNSPPVPASPTSRTDGQGRVTSLADSGSQTEADLPTAGTTASGTTPVTATTDTATATADSGAAGTASVLVEPGPQPELPAFNPELMRAKAPLAAPAVQGSNGTSSTAGVHAAAGDVQGGTAGGHTEGVTEGAAAGAHQIDGVGAVPAAKAGCRCTVM
jgi:hypothetical protein